MRNFKFISCLLLMLLLVGCSSETTTFNYDYNKSVESVEKIEVFDCYAKAGIKRLLFEIKKEDNDYFLYDLSLIEFTRKNFSIFDLYSGSYLDGIYIAIYHYDGTIEEINANYYSGEYGVSCSKDEFDNLIGKYTNN